MYNKMPAPGVIRSWAAASVITVCLILLSAHPAEAYWRGGVWIGVGPVLPYMPPPVYAPPPMIYVPPPTFYPPPYAPVYPQPYRMWVPGHWSALGWVPGHWEYR